MGASISLAGVYKEFGPLKVLEDWNVVIAPAERIAVLGLSGSGKTTFLRLLAGIEAPTRGELKVSSQDVGFVFQEPRLIPWRTVRQNLLFVNEQADIEQLLSHLHLQGFADYYPTQLSGGMRQRVNLARALAVSPELLIMDEAFASLDLKVKVDIMNDVLGLWRKHRFTMVTVTHDLKEALYLADRILMISSRPSRIVHEFPVSLPEKRSFASPELMRLEGELLKLVCQQ
jgi:NitT/TauT family transport system ATP-binding protein